MENPKLIHIGIKQPFQASKHYVFLRKVSSERFQWFEISPDIEKETSVVGISTEEAIRLANRNWKNEEFKLLNCGFRYQLPERDEHGINALFHQMAASYGSMNGVYYDEDVGHNCFVQNASQEALMLWRQLVKESRL